MGINIEGVLLEGKLVKRINRFVAKVLVDGMIYDAHVPNTGRMSELLVADARVIVRKVNSQVRKTSLDLLMVYKDNNLICIDSRMPNDLVYNDIIERNIKEFSNYLEVKREVQYKNSRFDIYINDGVKRTLLEVKCVTLFEDGVARFPDAPTDRGRKHIYELIDAKKNGIEGAVVFVVFSKDVNCFKPNDTTDPGFGKALREAHSEGVSILAYSCEITARRIELKESLKILL